MHSSIQKILAEQPLEASAPCRIDAGGTWDIKSMALPLERIQPATVNIAINLRTRITLTPFSKEKIKVSSEGFGESEEHSFERLPFNSPFGLFYAAVSYFGLHSLHINIQASAPVKSSLGGSSTAVVALLKALSRLASLVRGSKELSSHEILHLGYQLEDAVITGKGGVQDQAAAVYGGVNCWHWRFGKSDFLKRVPLLDQLGQQELSRCILVVFSGTSHVAARINQGWLQDFLSGKTRSGWIKTNTIVQVMAEALTQRDWERAAELLREEMAIRREITPNALIPLTAGLIDQAEELGCGARFAGAGAGGSVWALGEADKISALRQIWQKTLLPIKGARILDCAVDSKGVR